MTKTELQKMGLSELIALANKYNLSTDCKKSELIESILKVENPPKKKRGPRAAAKTKLKALRVASGLSQQELADAADLNVRTLQHYEQGSKIFDNARIDTILKVCKALDCTFEQIIENQEYIELFKEHIKKEAR